MKKNLLGLPRRAAFTLCLAFFGAAVIYSFLWPLVPKLTNDSERYMRTAVDLSDGSIDEFNERPPGLPLLIIATNSQVTQRKAFWYSQLLLYFAALWFLCVLLNSFGVSVTTIYLFVAFMLLPFNVENAGYVLTENLAQFFIVATVFGIIRWVQTGYLLYAVAAGIAISFAALTRPTYQALPFVIVPFMAVLLLTVRRQFVQKKNFVPAVVIFLFCFVLIVGGFSFLNYKKHGFFGITNLLGYSLSIKTVPYLERLPDEYAEIREYLILARDKQYLIRGSSHSALLYICTLGPDEIEKKLGMSSAEAANYMTKLNLVLISTAPMSYLNEVVESMPRYWFPTSSKLANMNSRLLQFSWNSIQFILVFLFFFGLIVLFGGSVFQLSRRISIRKLPSFQIFDAVSVQRLAYMLAVLIVLYTFFITCMVDIGDPRQRSGDALMVFAAIIGYRIWFCNLYGSVDKKTAISNN